MSAISDQDLDTLLRHTAWVRALAMRLGGPDTHAAEDAAQDTLLAYLRTPPRHGGNLLGFLARTLRNFLIMRQRADCRRERRQAAAAIDADACTEDTAELVARAELHRRIVTLVLALPEPQRTLVLHHYLEGVEVSVLAERHGMTSDAVRAHLRRARDKLRAEIDAACGSDRAAPALLLSAEAAAGAAAGGALIPTFLAGALTVMKTKLLIGIAATALALWIAVPLVLPPRPDPGATAAQPLEAQPAAPAAQPRTDTPERAVADAALFLVEVRNAQGAPVDGATVVLTSDEPRQQVTGDAGRASFPAGDRAAELRVSAPGFLTVVQSLERCTGTTAVVLGKGEVLDGVVEVDGRPPGEPITMELYMTGSPDKHEIVTGERGAFSVQGIEPACLARLTLPRAYWVVEPEPLADDPRAIELPPAKRGLRISLTELPCLRARLLRATDGAPLASAFCMVHVQFANGEETPSTGARADAQGRLRVPLVPQSGRSRTEWLEPAKRPAAREVSLSVRAEDMREAKLSFQDAQVPADLDLGDLRVDAGVELWVRVTSKAGTPIAGALVAADGVRGKPTDESGLARVFAASQRPVLKCAAVGFRFGALQPSRGTGARDDPLVLELAEGSVLVVRVRDPQGRPVASALVEIEGKEWRVPEHDPWLHQLVRFHVSRQSLRTSLASLTVETEASGEARLPGLAANASLTVRVVDAFGAVVVERQARTPSEVGKQVVELPLPKSPARVGGSVVDWLGRPARGANVFLSHAGTGSSTLTDADGRFRFDGLYAMGQKIDFLVQLSGHASHVHDPLPLDSDLDLRFQLQRGLAIRVSIVDPSNTPVDGGVSVAIADGAFVYKIGRGVYRVANLPAGPREFAAYVGGHRFTRKHDPALGDLRIEVPPAGEVDVDVEAAGIGKHAWLYVVLQQEATQPHNISAPLAGTYFRSPASAVLAGRYTAVLKVHPQGAAEKELRRSEITVVAGQRTTIR